MKPRLKLMGAGAAGGAALLLLFWLLGDVAHIIGLTLQDSSFFLGLVLFLIGLLMIVRGSKSFKAAARPGRRGPIAPDPPEEKDPSGPQEVRKAPFLCMGAGLLNILICAVTFLF